MDHLKACLDPQIQAVRNGANSQHQLAEPGQPSAGSDREGGQRGWCLTSVFPMSGWAIWECEVEQGQ